MTLCMYLNSWIHAFSLLCHNYVKLLSNTYYIVSVGVKVIQVINIAAYWAISIVHTLMIYSYSNTGIGFACSHSSSPILLQHQYHGHCEQKIIMSCWISEASSNSSCVSLSQFDTLLTTSGDPPQMGLQTWVDWPYDHVCLSRHSLA